MQFSVPHDHPSLPGHFPGRPLVPGVVVLERVLDAIEAGHGALGVIRLPQVKFLQPLLPGEQARVELERIEPAQVGSARCALVQLDPTLSAAQPGSEQPQPARPVEAAPAMRWRFRVVRDHTLLASGDIVAQGGQ